jgi:NADH-quinone oxidoreductase subunit F
MPSAPRQIMLATDVDYGSIARLDPMLGSGAVIMDDTRCMVRSLLRLRTSTSKVLRPVHAVREGTGWLWRMVPPIEHGEGQERGLDVLLSVSDNIAGRTICALGDTAALPVKASSSISATSSSTTSSTNAAWCRLRLTRTTTSAQTRSRRQTG